MKGDFTRSTFAPEKHYSGVRMQQGRVQLDADWNEQVDIEEHLREASLGDLIGAAGAPLDGGGFKIGLSADAADLTLSAGRLYVDGILVELGPDDATYTKQLAGVDPALAQGLPPALPSATGSSFVYVDVWQRHVTALEDPAIREVALGGPDTATRTQTFWQVKLLPVPAASHCLSVPQAWSDATAAPTSRLRARTRPGDPATGPCIVPASAGYTRLENQLYRVEVHKGGSLGAGATFKWSRNNGATAAAWTALDGSDAKKPKLTVSDTGRDKASSFVAGGWVEVTDDVHDVAGQPGILAQLLDVQGDVLTLDFTTLPALSLADFPVNPKVRAWESAGEPQIVQAADDDGYLPLEGGIEVRFEAGTYRTGDHWLIPARAFVGVFSGDIEWPADGSGNPLAEPPAGIVHHFCKLAVVDFDAGTKKFANVRDCRPRFPAVTELLHLFQVGGDGQEAMPGQTLPCPLAVGVANGQWPVPGAQVRFEVASGSGSIYLPLVVPTEPVHPVASPQAAVAGAKVAPVTPQTTLVVPTDADGAAGCFWTLPDAASAPACLAVTATLLDVAGNPVSIPVVFHAELSVASQVAYQPGACSLLATATTVQQALDLLCKALRQPGIAVLGVATGDGKDLANDTDVPVGALKTGVAVTCDQDVATALFSPPGGNFPVPARPNVEVTVYLPYPIGSDSGFWDFTLIVGFQPLVLGGVTSASGAVISWNPAAGCAHWLTILFDRLTGHQTTDRLLARLAVKGNFVWSAKDPSLFLDGDAFGRLVTGTIGLRLPSGDGRQGGDFESWFWLIPDPQPTLTATVSGLSVTGFLRDATGAGLAGVTISIQPPAGGPPLTTTTAADGSYRFAQVPTGTLTVQAQVPNGPLLTQTVTVVGTIAKPQLTDLAGIGAARSAQLAAAGIQTPDDLAKADPAKVASLLSVSVDQANTFITAAKGTGSGS